MSRTCPTCGGLGVIPDAAELPTDAALRAAADDAPTAKLPPIGETIRRRPPVPDVRELRGPALLRALADELDRDGLSIEDLAPCGAIYARGDGVEWVCGLETGHEGPHEVHGRRW
jgi:hypothetical protein